MKRDVPMPNTGENDKLLRLRGKFLHVSTAHNVLFHIYKFDFIFETLAGRKILYTVYEFRTKSTAKFTY
jgi:hypothetical protein